MKPLSLRKLLETADAATLLAQFANLSTEPVELAIFDQQGRPLVSYPSPASDGLLQAAATLRRTGEPLSEGNSRALPILANEQLIGVLAGIPASLALDKLLASLHSVFSILVTQAVERKSLAQELLERYREINLLYHLHETIGAQIELNQVAARALAESARIVKASSGALFLKDEITPEFSLAATEGDEPKLRDSRGIPRWVARKGIPAIVNDVQSDPRYKGDNPALNSLLCAPLKIQEKVLGVLCLCNKQSGGIFTAGDEKLLMAVASQTAVAIENARAVAARERHLRQQIQELRIEIDVVRKRRAVKKIADSDYFRHLAETAQQWREDLEHR